MDITLTPSKLSGSVTVPPSKSAAHRLIIAASLSHGESRIENLALSDDIMATIEGMRALGADIELSDSAAVVRGIITPPSEAMINCRESGSTLRFLMPIAAALGVTTTFFGSGNLPNRPITPYIRELSKKGVSFDRQKGMPITISGKLTGGEFSMEGDISSQFVTGLLFALTKINKPSKIVLTSKLQSKPYVDVTLDCLRRFGAEIKESADCYEVSPAELLASRETVEGDYSQAAFFVVANALGSDIDIKGLNPDSFQGDKKITEIVNCVCSRGKISPFTVDCSDIPDLVPILAVLATFADGRSEIKNVARLRIKECDRLNAMEQCLNRLGGKVRTTPDSLIIDGVTHLFGGSVYSYNDHRIAMSMAIASTKSRGRVTITDAQCVKKSFPDFFEVYKQLGGK